MNGSLQYSALARVLTLNNHIHDLENLILAVEVPLHMASDVQFSERSSSSSISDIQEEIDRTMRASLATCWLGNENEEEEYGL